MSPSQSAFTCCERPQSVSEKPSSCLCERFRASFKFQLKPWQWTCTVCTTQQKLTVKTVLNKKTKGGFCLTRAAVCVQGSWPMVVCALSQANSCRKTEFMQQKYKMPNLSNHIHPKIPRFNQQHPTCSILLAHLNNNVTKWQQMLSEVIYSYYARIPSMDPTVVT